MPNQTIYKQMTPEEIASLENIKAMIDQALAGSSIEAAPDPLNTPQEAEKQQGENNPLAAQLRKMADEIEKECGTLPKNEVEKASEGPTANESGEERLSTSTEVNDSNISEVGKMLHILRKSMDQSPQAQVNNNVEVAQMVVQGLAPVLKSMQERQNIQDETLKNVLDALGVSENVMKSLETPEPKPAEIRPVTAQDAGLFFAELMDVVKSRDTQYSTQPVGRIGNSNAQTYQKSLEENRKNLAGAMSHLFGKKG